MLHQGAIEHAHGRDAGGENCRYFLQPQQIAGISYQDVTPILAAGSQTGGRQRPDYPILAAA